MCCFPLVLQNSGMHTNTTHARTLVLFRFFDQSPLVNKRQDLYVDVCFCFGIYITSHHARLTVCVCTYIHPCVFIQLYLFSRSNEMFDLPIIKALCAIFSDPQLQPTDSSYWYSSFVGSSTEFIAKLCESVVVVTTMIWFFQ